MLRRSAAKESAYDRHPLGWLKKKIVVLAKKPNRQTKANECRRSILRPTLCGRHSDLCKRMVHSLWNKHFQVCGVVQELCSQCGSFVKFFLQTHPACLSKRAVFAMYQEEMAGQPLLLRSHFLYKMWKVNVPEVYMLRLFKLRE